MKLSIERILSLDSKRNLGNCSINTVSAVKVYYIKERRNQWINWSGDTDIVGTYWGVIHFSLDEATSRIEKARTSGSQYAIEETVAIIFSSDNFALLVCDMYSESPFADFISKPVWKTHNNLYEISKAIPSSKYRLQYLITGLTQPIKECTNDEQFYLRSSSSGGKKNGLAWSLKSKELNGNPSIAFAKAFNDGLNKSVVTPKKTAVSDTSSERDLSSNDNKSSVGSIEESPTQSLAIQDVGTEQLEGGETSNTLNSGQSAYLYTWNPKKWKWSDLQDAIYRVNNGEDYDIYWSCGVRKKIEIGDIFFLMKLGVEPKGIVGCGYIASLPYPLPHWDETKANEGQTALRTNVIFKALSDEPIFSLSFLQDKYSSVHWTPEVGGVIIPNNISEELWRLVQGNNKFSFTPNTTQEITKYAEGGVKLVTYKTYDRSADARNKCIEYYGYNCSVCGFNYEANYGVQGKDFIEVHHLKKIADIAQEYEINPIIDLRPVCANCHRMLHRKKITLSIEELQLAITKL